MLLGFGLNLLLSSLEIIYRNFTLCYLNFSSSIFKSLVVVGGGVGGW